VASHVFETMGTVVSASFRDGLPDSAILNEIERVFREWDDRYSLYRPETELSRLASGEVSLLDASKQLRSTYELALEWRSSTGGAFTPHRPDGVMDLSGVVKAMAMAAAANGLESAGAGNWAINVGGDIVISPTSGGVDPWRVGIVDPQDRTEFLTSVALEGDRRACATSGVSERGDHIWRAHGRSDFVQATVLANDIVTADVLATAIIAGGAETLDLACRSWPIDVITVDAAGALRMTPGAVSAMNRASFLPHM
jgi:thiamine biosynthesis lipoprotein